MLSAPHLNDDNAVRLVASRPDLLARAKAMAVGSRTPFKPTPQQVLILDFIRDFTNGMGYAPSYKEIGAAIGKTAPWARGVVITLEQRGIVARLPGKSRAISIVGDYR